MTTKVLVCLIMSVALLFFISISPSTKIARKEKSSSLHVNLTCPVLLIKRCYMFIVFKIKKTFNRKEKSSSLHDNLTCHVLLSISQINQSRSYNVELMFAASFDSKMGCLYSVFDAKKQGKPAWVVRTKNWKLREGENRLSGLLEGVSVSGNVFT
ncbi:hypothetical protein GQ457_11G023780 [Hibiscus cannabinus]